MDENWLVISFTVDKLFVLGLVYNTQGFQAVKKNFYAHYVNFFATVSDRFFILM